MADQILVPIDALGDADELGEAFTGTCGRLELELTPDPAGVRDGHERDRRTKQRAPSDQRQPARQAPAPVVRLRIRSSSPTATVSPDAWTVLQSLRNDGVPRAEQFSLNHLMVGAISGATFTYGVTFSTGSPSPPG